MRFRSFLASGFSLAILLSGVSATLVSNASEPEIVIVASFPEDNPFGHVVNGEKNTITLAVENKSGRNVTLTTVAGSFHDPETNNVIKNTTAFNYGVQLLEGTKLKIPYTFYSEFKPGDMRLNLWIEHVVEDEKYRVTAYDSIVTIVEPEVSIFDFKLVSTYLIVSAILGSVAYLAYLSFFPQKKARKTAVSAPVGTTTAGGYQEEWIPEHHIKKSKSDKKKGGATGGDETSGTESDVKKRKGRK